MKTQIMNFSLGSNLSRISLASLICLCMLTIGSGNVWGAETLVYTLDGTVTDGSNGYDTESEIKQNGIPWKVKGNTTMSPWRIGGKSITSVDRKIYSTGTFTDDISKVTVETGATASGCTVNSIKLIVSTAQNGGGTVTDQETKTSGLTSATLTFSRPAGHDWSGKYFTIVINVTRSSSSGNGYVAFNNAKFYKETTPAYTITAVSNNVSYGTVSVSGTTITATPKDGYRVKSGDAGYTVTSGTADVTNNGDNTFSVTPSSDCTITINFEAIPQYTVTWDVNGDQSVKTQVTEGSKPTFPATPSSCDGTSTTFYGWSTSEWSGKIDDISAKTIYTSAASMPTVSGAVTYYAVFADAADGSSSKTYELTIERGDVPSSYSGTWSAKTATETGGGSGTLSVSLSGTNVMQSTASGHTTHIQFKASSTGFYNTTDLGTINSITTNNSDIKYYINSSSNPSSSGSGGYFRVYNNTNGARYTASIVINFTKTVGGTTYSDYITTCANDPCASLQAPNVTDIATANSITLSWAAVDGATSYNVYNYTTEEAEVVNVLTYTFNELDPETEYEWEVEAVSATCDGKGTKGTTTTSATPCEKLGAATGLTVETDFVQDGQTYVKFSWTPADNTKDNAASQKICFGKVDEAGTCKDNLAKNQTWIGDLKSKLKPGEYWWSIQALGDGVNYCDGDVVNGTNFTIEAPTYTVTFHAGSGSCDDESLTEASGGAGVTLPTANPPAACATDGWEFAGWWTGSVAETTTSPGELLTAGSNYKPASDCTLYAVYSYTEAGGGGGTEVIFNFGYTDWGKDDSFSGTTYSTVEQNKNGVSVTYTGNEGSLYANTTSLRLYKTNTLTFDAGSNTITSITFTGGIGQSDITTDAETCTNSTNTLSWAGSSKSVTFTRPSNASGYATLTSATLTIGGGTTTTYNSNPSCEVCENILTINKGAETNGNTFTLSQSGNVETCDGDVEVVVTPTPAEHYSVSAVTATAPTTGDAPTVTNKGDGTWTVTYTQNSTGESTINVTFVQDAKASITLSELGVPTTDNTTYYVGETYTLPTTSSQSCDGKQLVGWSTVEVAETDTKPTENYYELGAEVTLAATQTFYAVFATAEGDGGSAGEITTVAIGDQVVIIQIDDEKTELTGFRPDKVITDNNNYGTYAAYSTTPSATLVWTVEEGANDGTFAFKNGNYYLNLGGNDNYLSCSTTKNTSSSWTVTESDDRAIVTNVEHNSRKIMWNQGSPRFASYAKNHGLNSNQYYYHIKFYKLNGGTTYSAYTTLCDTTKATITYDLNGGTGEPCAKTTVTKGEEFDLCDQTPTKEGYDFAGWTDGVNTYAAGATVTVNESTTFYAKWNAKTITITWDQNYTDCPEPIEMQYVYDSDENTMPEEPVREGFQFVGWFTGLTDGIEITEIGEENRPTDDVTYYAHWNELYSITFMASGQVYVVQEDKYLSGANLELPADPSAANYACDGYIFDGWSVTEKPIEEATKPVLVTNSTTIDADETYYAVWKKATTEGAGETIFYESFDDNDAGGGNDGNFNTASSTEECYADNAGWEGNKFYEADQCIKLGGSSAKGYITTPALSQLGGNATLSFKAAAWNGSSESTTLVLSIAGGGSLSKTSVTLTKGAWQSYEVTITGGTPSTRITFEGKNTSNSRFFLDEVKVTTSGSYNYTTSPSCGPTIVAKDGMWVTSANGQSVKVNVPIAIKSFTNNATITGTTANSNFVVTTLENIGNGEHNLVVTYTPNASNIKEDATITLTAKVGEETISTTTFTLNGRSLPDEFVIVAQYNDKWLAVPANMQSGADQYNGIEVTPNNELTQIPAAPSTTIYSLRGVADNRYEEAGTCVRLVGNGNKCLWGNAASTNTTIQNWTTLASTNGSNYEWLLTTSDGELYTIANPAHPDYNQGRILSNSGSKYGLYKGTTKFYILPVGCSSLPGNIQVTARRVDATFSWEGNASSMQIDIYTNEGMTEGHISNTATASPYYMTGLSESTQYWFEMTPNGTDDACAYTGSFKTTGPTIDVVEWQENAAVIFVDKDEELNPLVIIDGEVEHGVGTGSQATELFFSKYFEAHAENKLLAIYNGTPNTIYLTGYTIKSENGTLDLSQFGQTKGQIAPNEEIILVYFDATYSAASCAERQDNYETWNVLNDKSVLAFSGRGSIGLYKNDVLIDVIGSTFPSGELTKIGKSDSPDNCGTGSDVRLYVEGFSVNDQSSFFCYNGDNIKTPEVENDYAISTNRCLLIRKNSVTSGANAVANNKADAGATCGDLSTTFTTLCSEWSGFRIGGGKSSNEEIKDATCDGLGYVGGFDYNKYYKEYTNIDDDTYLELYTHDDATKEYTIPIDNLAQYSCLNLRFQLKQGDQVLTEEPVQVPIIVSGEKATNDAIFNAIVKTDGDLPVYNQSIERCKTCNVVVLSDATLTKAADGATNDVAEVYNMKVYPGGQVVVPASTEYTVNSLAFRRQEDEVSMANIQGTLNVKHTNGVYLDVRIDPSNWHYMTLPYDCRVGDVTFADGTPAVVNTDYLLGWYDGAYRAEHKTGGWTYITDNDYILKKGLGYIVALPGDGKVRREIRFPMANDVIAEDLTGKTVSGLYAYGGDKTDAELRPNHKGWNMIGSPYLYTYTTDIVKEPLQMGTLEHSPVNPWDGTWVRTGEARYIVEPIDNGWSGYRQTTISNLKPFTSYFIQVGGVKNGEEYTTVTPEDEQQILFAANSVARNASAPRKVAEAEVTDNHPVWYGVEMIAPNNEKDNTTLLISDEFTDGYDMMDDLVKMRGDYYQYYNFPVLASRNNEGEMAFNALPDSTAAKIGVPLNYYAATAGTYTIATDGKFDLEEVKAAMLYDATTAQYTNLLTDNYSFTTNKGNNTNRFTLFVTVERKKVPNITTGMDNLLANGQLSLIAIERTLVLSGLTENADIYVYDMNGKLVTGTHTIGDNGVWRTIVPATGVYFVRVNSANNQQTLRTIVK